MQILKKIILIFLFAVIIICGIELYENSILEKEKNIELGKLKFKEDLVLNIETKLDNNCQYSNVYINIIPEKELKDICIKLKLINKKA